MVTVIHPVVGPHYPQSVLSNPNVQNLVNLFDPTRATFNSRDLSTISEKELLPTTVSVKHKIILYLRVLWM